MTCKNRPRCDL